MDEDFHIDAKALLAGVFPSLSQEAIGEVVTLAATRTYPPGTVLCRQGAVEHTFFLISAGRVEVLHELEGGHERPLRQAGPGEYFGELAIIMDAPRAATVRTIAPTTVIELDKAAFVHMLGRDPLIGLSIMRTVLEWLRANEQRTIAELEAKTEQVEAAYTALAQREMQRAAFLSSVANGVLPPLIAAQDELHRLNSRSVESLPAAEMDADIRELHHNVDAIIQQVNDLMFVQSLEPIQASRRPLPVSRLLRDIVTEARPSALKKRLQIAAAIAPDLPPVEGDEDGLARAFRAVLENAIRSSPEGGVILVTARAVKTQIEVTFADSGKGFSKDLLGRLFEPFGPAAIQSEDAGLGLAIAHYWVGYHGGAISVESEVGRGATFTIRLPASAR